MSPRFAIYWAPERATQLWRLGSATIGYDAATGQEPDPHPPTGVPAEVWRSWTAEPRRYGFHATLKAPFHLEPGHGEPDVIRVAERLAAELAPVRLPRLVVRLLGPFAALVPEAPAPGLAALEAACVRAFEPLRAPVGAADRARRLATGLSERQAEYLDRYGYPYVLDEFRLHLTLTGPLEPGIREPVRAALAERFREPCAGAVIEALNVFRQDSRSERFRIVARAPLRG